MSSAAILVASAARPVPSAAVLLALTGAGNVPPVAKTYPAAMRTAPWKFAWASAYAHTALPNLYPTLITFDEASFASLFFERPAATTYLRWYCANATIHEWPVTFASGQSIEVSIDPTAPSITLSGFASGNGTFAISDTLVNLWPTGTTIRFGEYTSTAEYPSGGTFGDVVAA